MSNKHAKVHTELHQAENADPEALKPYMPDDRLLPHSIDENAVTYLNNAPGSVKQGRHSHREHENESHTT